MTGVHVILIESLASQAAASSAFSSSRTSHTQALLHRVSTGDGEPTSLPATGNFRNAM
jgi:hypothetical protein